jgi:rhamnulokinase
MSHANRAATVLAFDLGATSGRAILGRVDRGNLEFREVHRFPNDAVMCGGELHWDILRLWHEVQAGLRQAGGIALDSIGVDTWGVDYALLGESGSLLGNPFHYRDQRTKGSMERACSAVGSDRIYDSTGIQFMPFNTLFQVYADAARTPGLFSLAKTLLTIPDLLNYWLTGSVGCEYTNATTTQFLDRRTKSWALDLLRDLGVPTHLLAPVVQPGTIIGSLRRELIHGEEHKLTVVAAPACHDTGSAVAAVLARGATAFLSSGTWSLLGTEVDEAVVSSESRRLNFTNEGGVAGTFRLLKNITGLWLLEGCLKSWQVSGEKYSYATLLDMAKAAKPLQSFVDPDDSLFVAPDDMPRAIDEYCRKTEQPVPQTHGAYTRVVLESLALKYRYVLEQLGALTAVQFRNIRVIGGGCRNALLNQFTADATGCQVLAGPAEATALGNMAMQLVAIDAVGSIGEARDL